MLTPLPADAVTRAMKLAGAVHDEGPDEVAHVLTTLTRQQLYDLAVTLAAMVPVDYSPAELVAWNDAQYTGDKPTAPQPTLFPKPLGRPVKPHGTHAAHVRHKSRGETPCETCVLGEQAWQAARHLRRRAQEREAS